MPRKLKPRKYGTATAESMSNAVDLVLNKNYSVRQAAVCCNVKYPTLQRYVMKKQRNLEGNIRMEPNYYHRQLFKDEHEEVLSHYLETCSKMAYGLTTVDVRKLAFEVAIVNNVTIPESWRNPKKIIASKGVKQVNHCVSRERGELVTTCGIISALGTFLPPVLIFPRKYFKAHMLVGALPGTLGLATPSGWMNSEIFIQVLDHFIKYSNSSKDKPSLLIYDNHESHISVQIVNKAREAGVKILTLPPHCSNRMQPLDVAVYGSFKSYFNAACDKWMLKNPGTPLTIYNIAECVAEAHCKAFTLANIISGFFKTGIMPFNPDIFTDADFIQSEVTNRPLDNQEAAGPSNTAGSSNTADASISNSPQPDSSYVLPREVTQLRFISPEDIRGLPKAKPRKQLRRARAKGRSSIITDTPEKQILEEKENLKAVKLKNKKSITVVLDEAKEKPPKKKRKIVILEEKVTSETSDEEETVDYKDSSSDWEPEQEDENNYFTGDMNIVKGCFVLVKFVGGVHYVANVLTDFDEVGDCEVTYLRKSNKCSNSFLYPNNIDVASVNKSDVTMVLPNPKPSHI